MARLTLDDLYSAIEAHPRYYAEWQDDIPARQSVRIRMVEKLPSVRSEVLELVGGKELVLDMDDEGRVVAIEIV